MANLSLSMNRSVRGAINPLLNNVLVTVLCGQWHIGVKIVSSSVPWPLLFSLRVEYKTCGEKEIVTTGQCEF